MSAGHGTRHQSERKQDCGGNSGLTAHGTKDPAHHIERYVHEILSKEMDFPAAPEWDAHSRSKDDKTSPEAGLSPATEILRRLMGIVLCKKNKPLFNGRFEEFPSYF